MYVLRRSQSGLGDCPPVRPACPARRPTAQIATRLTSARVQPGAEATAWRPVGPLSPAAKLDVHRLPFLFGCCNRRGGGRGGPGCHGSDGVRRVSGRRRGEAGGCRWFSAPGSTENRSAGRCERQITAEDDCRPRTDGRDGGGMGTRARRATAQTQSHASTAYHRPQRQRQDRGIGDIRMIDMLKELPNRDVTLLSCDTK